MFRFAGIIRKYEVIYTLLRHGKGSRNSAGEYVRPVIEYIPLRGAIQPLGDRLLQADGGRYNEDDRRLFTVYKHQKGDVIEHNDKQYTIDDEGDRADYSDTFQYKMKRVSTHDPVR
ncbi:hypothetical protein [Paenibacillus plantiphilus]|nr:hypothetical protein [Paenibacillus plantiphilus]